MSCFKRTALEHAVAGSSGTVLATLLLFPMERIKTLLQVLDATPRSQRVNEVEAVRRLLAAVLRNEGLGGFYRGCGPMVQTVGVSNLLFFFLFESLKKPISRRVSRTRGVVGPYAVLAASAIAGAVNMMITEPLWRACVIMQLIAREPIDQRTGLLATLTKLVREEGCLSLWRGLGSSLWLVCNPVIQFFAYDLIKSLKSGQDVSSVEAFMMGALAKALATVLTFPLQVAQSRLRASGTSKEGPQGMLSCLRVLLHERGVAGLYIGLGPKLLQTCLNASFMFAFYEKMHWAIRQLSKSVEKTHKPLVC